jgi:hypothetical protein
MAMSAWSMLAAPLLAAAQMQLPDSEPEAALAAASTMTALEVTGDALFGDLPAMDDTAMSLASGGESTAIDIGGLGVNISTQNGDVSDTEVNNTTTGQIAGNVVTDNGGITTVFNNTGNGVIFQSTVNVNIFTAPELGTN